LGQLIQKIGASMYQQTAEQPGGTGEAGGKAGDAKGDEGEDVVDGEFKNV